MNIIALKEKAYLGVLTQKASNWNLIQTKDIKVINPSYLKYKTSSGLINTLLTNGQHFRPSSYEEVCFESFLNKSDKLNSLFINISLLPNAQIEERKKLYSLLTKEILPNSFVEKIYNQKHFFNTTATWLGEYEYHNRYKPDLY